MSSSSSEGNLSDFSSTISSTKEASDEEVASSASDDYVKSQEPVRTRVSSSDDHGDVVSSDEGVVSASKEVVSSVEDVVSSDEDVVSANREVVSSDEDVLSPDEDVLSPDEDVLSPDEDTVSARPTPNEEAVSDEGVVLSDEDVISARPTPNEEVVSSNEETVLSDEDVLSPDEDVVSPDWEVLSSAEEIVSDEGIVSNAARKRHQVISLSADEHTQVVKQNCWRRTKRQRMHRQQLDLENSEMPDPTNGDDDAANFGAYQNLVAHRHRDKPGEGILKCFGDWVFSPLKHCLMFSFRSLAFYCFLFMFSENNRGMQNESGGAKQVIGDFFK